MRNWEIGGRTRRERSLKFERDFLSPLCWMNLCVRAFARAWGFIQQVGEGEVK